MALDRVKRANKLIGDIALGRIEALDMLYQEYGGLLLLYARRYLFDTSYAEDLVSDLLVKLVGTASQYKAGFNGLNWMYKSIKNMAYNHNKHSGKIAFDNIDDHTELASVFAEEQLLDGIVLHHALSQLDSVSVQLLHLKYWQGLTIREIAVELGVTKSKAHRMIDRVLHNMDIIISGDKS